MALKIKVFRGTEQWTRMKFVKNKLPDGKEEELAEPPQRIMTADEHLEKQTNRWLTSHKDIVIKQIVYHAHPFNVGGNQPSAIDSLLILYEQPKHMKTEPDGAGGVQTKWTKGKGEWEQNFKTGEIRRVENI